MCIVMETNELPSIDDKLVDTSTIHTTKTIYNLLNISSRVHAGASKRRRATLLPQGVSLYGYFDTHRPLDGHLCAPCPRGIKQCCDHFGCLTHVPSSKTAHFRPIH